MTVKDLPETNPNLMLRLSDLRDREAWREFVDLYWPLIYRVARKQGLQDADALNLVQDVLHKVSVRLEQRENYPEGGFRRWLSVVARNASIDALRRLKPDAPAGGTSVQRQLHAISDRGDNAEHVILAELRKEAFRWAAVRIRSEFNESTWAAFWETMVSGETCQAVAERLGRTVGAVYTSRSRVMQRLRREVAKFNWDQHEDDGGALQ